MASTSKRSFGRRDDDRMEDDLSNVEFETSEEVKCVNSFDKMGLKEPLLRGIYAYGSFRLMDLI